MHVALAWPRTLAAEMLNFSTVDALIHGSHVARVGAPANEAVTLMSAR